MNQRLTYFLIIAGLVLFILNLWSADFDTSKINYLSSGASVLMVIVGFLKLNTKQKNEN
ncbi:hypothetical protein [Kaistella polysaccharea]|uniref:hypothetical protein n=1 Tax=Kaistella polysaccharea TaxID=2878534 RepID=UPI001CF1EAC1|nr:hypothetical protein [Kaistella polysaccharea]